MIRAPVHYEVEPERVAEVRHAEGRGPLANTRMLVERGLRAQLQSANLLTGQMRVALEIDPDAPAAELGTEGDLLVMPTSAGGFASIENAAKQLLNNLGKMPFEQIGRNLNDTLSGASDVVNGRELQQALVSLQKTLGNADQVVRQLDAGLTPALRQLPAIATGLQTSVAQAGRLMGSVNTGYGENSKFSRDVDRLMSQLNDTARALRSLADLLTRHPEALVRGRTNLGPQ
jgi:paraquat-inducible protein B